MKQQIYLSDYVAGPEATEKQEHMFTADLDFAILKGYQYITTADGITFYIDSPEHLIEADVTEATLAAAGEAVDSGTEARPESAEDESQADFFGHNIFLIDSIINNTLTQKENITAQQAENMLKLAHTRATLIGCN